jgi:hypothetical protein
MREPAALHSMSLVMVITEVCLTARRGVHKQSVTDAAVTGGTPGISAFAATGEQVQLDGFAAASVSD